MKLIVTPNSHHDGKNTTRSSGSPDSFGPPEKDLIDKIDNWLSADRYRTLVFVARDFDAAVTYWDLLANNIAADDNVSYDELRRRYHLAWTKYLSFRHTLPFKNCDWYDIDVHPFTKAKTISGDLAAAIDTSDADIRYATLPAPGNVTSTGDFGDYSVDVLMSVDSKSVHLFTRKAHSSRQPSYCRRQRIVLVEFAIGQPYEPGTGNVTRRPCNAKRLWRW